MREAHFSNATSGRARKTRVGLVEGRVRVEKCHDLGEFSRRGDRSHEAPRRQGRGRRIGVAREEVGRGTEPRHCGRCPQVRLGERNGHGVGGGVQVGLSTGRSASPGSDRSSRRRRPRRRGVRPCRGRRGGRRSRTAIALMAVVATMAVIQTAPIARPIQAQTLAPGVSPRPPRRPPRPSTTAITIGRSSVAAAPQVSARRTGSRCMKSQCRESGATSWQRARPRKSVGAHEDCRQA